jgi:hypothetical protein
MTDQNRDDDMGQGGQGGGGQGGGGQGGGGQGGEENQYTWALPPGDTSPTGNEGPAYNVLLGCQDAEAKIVDFWPGFNNPRNVLMFMAAAHLCHGDTAGGRPLYNRAVSEYGLAGVQNDPLVCAVYKSVASVLLQKQRESFTCAGGEEPQWKIGPAGKDNPLTVDVDESQPSTSDPGETSPSNAEEGTTSAAEGMG